MIMLDMPIERMPKVSRQIVIPLKRLGINTVGDLLLHLPFRYDDFSHVKKISDVKQGEVVTVCGKITSISPFRTHQSHKLLVQASLADDSGTLNAIWFNQLFLYRNITVGDTVNLSGKIELRNKGLILQNPSYEKISSRSLGKFIPLHTGKLVPVYPETRGITSRWLRFLISSCISVRKQMIDPIPAEVRENYGIVELKDAVMLVHAPQNIEEAHAANKRFQFEEGFLMQIYMLRERSRLNQKHAPPIVIDISLIKEFVASLPFSLTNAQRRSMWEIMKDMEKTTPMNRLLQGDVGSGKTVVAAAAMLLCAKQKKNVAFLAPTEILAKQHLYTIEKIISPFGVAIGFYTGSEKHIPSHARIFVGTHALVQRNVRIKNLCLVIIDEQHRFGVEQRAALLHNYQSPRESPHFLSMSATPIPRTLALTIYGDLDLSMLNEMPENRKPVITKIVSPGDRKSAYMFIRNEVKKGRQVFVVCPRIEKNENMQDAQQNKKIQQKLIIAEVKTVTDEYKKLSSVIFPDLRIGMLHGKLKQKEKNSVMQDFKDKKIDILVATSVIEVGVDMPNASVMMIEGAERFGLAQLHQFRGRVGRGSEQSYCFLFSSENGMATRRLDALTKTTNGSELAEIDLQLRGPGDFLGARQWGTSFLSMATLNNPYFMRNIRKAAQEIIKKDPDLQTYPLVKKKISIMGCMIHRE